MPRIGQYRGLIEAQATRAVGLPVRIGSISAQSQGWLGAVFPRVELRDVVLYDAQQREALRLAHVVASVSPRSLWRLGVEQLYVERPQMVVRMDPQGKLHVAGLELAADASGESAAADWLFGQREVVIQGGAVQWTDERRAAPPLWLNDVRFVARNSARRHMLRLDATPPPEWGQRFTLMGEFRQPLLFARSGNWKKWSGQFYVDLPHVDVAHAGPYVAADAPNVRTGNGALRAWFDLRAGAVTGADVDMNLAEVDVTLAQGLQPLQLRSVSGRLAGHWDKRALELSTAHLQFETSAGVRWDGGNLWLQHRGASTRAAEQGAFRADKINLGILARIADSLPLGEKLNRQLAELAPQGLVERIDLSWNGPMDAPSRYHVRGRVVGLAIAALPGQAPIAPIAPNAPTGAASAESAAAHVPLGRPGVRGATIDFDASHMAGNATLSIAKGALEFPGVFEDPKVEVAQLSSHVQWKVDGERIEVQMPDLRFANADAQGEARLDWRTSDPASSPSRSRFPGVLDLSGRLARADGTRVFRYLPLHIAQHVRDYVRDAVRKGSSSDVEFRVRGDLHDMPFTNPRQGQFRIAARIAGATYAYVPHGSGGAAAASVWPALTDARGDLIFEGAGMRARNVNARLAGAPGIAVKGQAEIADMGHGTPLKVDAQAKGPLAEALRLTAQVLGPTHGALAASTRASGDADYRLHLEMPLHDPEKARVQAAVTLAGNELQFLPALPAFTQARGTVNFTETGFALAADVRAQLAGGEARIAGKGRYAGAGQEMSFRAQGSLSAEGLRAAREIGWLAPIGRAASGSTSYTADFSLHNGVPELSFASDLRGLGLQLPAPVVKSPAEAMPLRIEKKAVPGSAHAGMPPEQDRLSFSLGNIAAARYLRDISGPEARVIAGGIAVGSALGPDGVVVPEQDVLAHVELPRLDVDAWYALFGGLAGADTAAPAATPSATAKAARKDVSGYWPTQFAIRAREVRVANRRLTNVVLGGRREGARWSLSADSDALSGYAEYRQSQGGLLHARLARLKIDPAEATQQVESLLNDRTGSLPALDIVIDDFQLHDKHLGRAEIEAVNRGGAAREWRMNKLRLSTPDAVFDAQGSWAMPRGGVRRTDLDFKIDINDAGALLGRLGMPGVLRRGRGQLKGTVTWRGSPFALDYPSMGGKLSLDVASGQFLKADPGLAKLLGVLSLQALPRRLTLDFRDVFSQGFAFDFVRGDAAIERGIVTTNNLQMNGVSAGVLLAGSADLVRETQDLRVVVVPEINAGTAALVATAINPAIGLGAFLANFLLRKPLAAAATQEFHIGGTWVDPKIAKLARTTAPQDAPNTETSQ